MPSSVLMTAVTARTAGVREVWLASPRPGVVTRAAAALAGVDGVLAVGGAHAVAALVFGVGAKACDVVVGPGNRWVTAAKKLLAGRVGIVEVAMRIDLTRTRLKSQDETGNCEVNEEPGGIDQCAHQRPRDKSRVDTNPCRSQR